MSTKLCIVLSALVVASQAQRPSYAGRRPIGYPEMEITTATTTTQSGDLGNRFGDDNAPSTTTMRLPLEALGDRDLVNRLSRLPLDKRPFWLINWQALENHRQRPLTYPQRPNGFIHNINQNTKQF